MSTTTNRHGSVTILSILAWIAAFFAAVRVLQSLAILPIFPGSSAVTSFNLWAAVLWGLMAGAWFWLTQRLRRADPQAWVFLAVINMFNLVLGFNDVVIKAEWSEVSLGFLFNAVIAVSCMLPKVRKAFGLS